MKNSNLTGLVVGLMLLGMINVASATPIQWTTGVGANNNWYELVDSSFVDWTDAKTAASSATHNGLAGHLATITSAEENTFIFSMLNVGNQPAWLGGFQDADVDESIADWQWVTGEEWSYSNFAPGEPNNSTWNDEDSLAFAFWKADGSWNDAPTGYNGYSNGAYVVEYDSAPVPEPATMLLFGVGLLGLAGVRAKKMKK